MGMGMGMGMLHANGQQAQQQRPTTAGSASYAAGAAAEGGEAAEAAAASIGTASLLQKCPAQVPLPLACVPGLQFLSRCRHLDAGTSRWART